MVAICPIYNHNGTLVDGGASGVWSGSGAVLLGWCLSRLAQVDHHRGAMQHTYLAVARLGHEDHPMMHRPVEDP